MNIFKISVSAAAVGIAVSTVIATAGPAMASQSAPATDTRVSWNRDGKKVKACAKNVGSVAQHISWTIEGTNVLKVAWEVAPKEKVCRTVTLRKGEANRVSVSRMLSNVGGVYRLVERREFPRQAGDEKHILKRVVKDGEYRTKIKNPHSDKRTYYIKFWGAKGPYIADIIKLKSGEQGWLKVELANKGKIVDVREAGGGIIDRLRK